MRRIEFKKKNKIAMCHLAPVTNENQVVTNRTTNLDKKNVFFFVLKMTIGSLSLCQFAFIQIVNRYDKAK